MKPLVIGLGNELLADDAVGILVARALRSSLGEQAEVVECSLHGLALLDVFIGHDAVILVDAIQTGKNPPGTVVEINPDELKPVAVPSPHFAGLPEMRRLAEQLGLDFPKLFRIIAVEISDATTIGGALTPTVKQAIPEVCVCVHKAIKTLKEEL